MEITTSHGPALIRNAMAANRQVAGRLARGDTTRLAEDMVELSENKHTVRLGVTIIRIEDETQRSLLDVLA